MSLPVSLANCPIVDAVLDLQFSTKIDPNAVFGVIYSKLRENFSKVESLPLAMTPEPVRNADPNLRFRPLYRLINNNDPNYIVQIGPADITISSSPEYIGWERFYQNIESILSTVFELDIIRNVIRIGLRYINFFDSINIFDGNTRVHISIDDSELPYKETQLRTIINNGNMNSIVQVMNEVLVNKMGKTFMGSVIDIDTFINVGLDDIEKQKECIIQQLHEEEKKHFFGLLTENFIKNLGPSY